MVVKKTKGCQRILIQQIENQSDKYASFSKRRLSLYKKVNELSTLCGADMGIMIFSLTGNLYSFFSPSMDVLMRRYKIPNQHPDRMTRYIEDHLRNQVQQQNQQLDEVPVESLGPGEVLEWTAWFMTLQA
ncbi:agamous-like MADS-box protein AGL62 [Andrographis paniculata]|uniref:agamous-like MADS-box protein AGL62 n=1 Tax=Andrographis paniculata TaxID=175694 RepID=UPI0021E7F969|nr:agamous-like MADS-box protein AGL62 [Andrographis paniculata]